MPVSWKEPRKICFYLYFYIINTIFSLRGGRYVLRVINDKNRRLRPQLIWKIAMLLGVRLTTKDEVADLVYAHEDSTYVSRTAPWPADAINGRCVDISKKNVQEVFHTTFGYRLSVDPLTYEGALVEKSNQNALHDGHIICGPMMHMREGCVYQRLINNVTKRGLAEDLRACVIAGEIPFVYVKQRPESIRFSNYNTYVYWETAENVFAKEEVNHIIEFCRHIQLDMGELDILRDRDTGKIYIVDVAKTPHSPSDQFLSVGGIQCMHRAALSFRRAFLGRASPPRAGHSGGGRLHISCGS